MKDRSKEARQLFPEIDQKFISDGVPTNTRAWLAMKELARRWNEPVRLLGPEYRAADHMTLSCFTGQFMKSYRITNILQFRICRGRKYNI